MSYTHRVTKPWTNMPIGTLVDASGWRNRDALERTRYIAPLDTTQVVGQALGTEQPVSAPLPPAKVVVNEPKKASKGVRRNAETGEPEPE